MKSIKGLTRSFLQTSLKRRPQEAFMNREDALDDLRIIRRILEKTHRRIDPHLFHFIIWGGVVLVWFPLLNFLELTGRGHLEGIVCAVAPGVGTLLSATFGFIAARRPRLPTANSYLAHQIGGIVAVFIASGITFRFVLPAVHPGGQRFALQVWGFAYALMVLVLGVVYSREFLGFGIFMFLASLVSLAM